MDLLVDVHSSVATAATGDNTSNSRAVSPGSDHATDNARASTPREEGVGGDGGGDVDAQINTLVRVGLLERSSPESVRFVAKYMVTVIYDMILHSKRQDMHTVSG